MAILLAVGQDMNARRSHVAKGATVTLNMHMVTFVGARTFITSAQGCNCSEAPCSCGRHSSAFLMENQGELKEWSWDRWKFWQPCLAVREMPGAQCIYLIKEMIRWCLYCSPELPTGTQPFVVGSSVQQIKRQKIERHSKLEAETRLIQTRNMAHASRRLIKPWNNTFVKVWEVLIIRNYSTETECFSNR